MSDEDRETIRQRFAGECYPIQHLALLLEQVLWNLQYRKDTLGY